MYKYTFITETKDHTCCFHCRIILANWQEADSVWQEHAKYSPKCLYLTHIKSAEFVLNSVVLKTIRHFMCYIVLCVCSWF